MLRSKQKTDDGMLSLSTLCSLSFARKDRLEKRQFHPVTPVSERCVWGKLSELDGV
jgi:hypothetical protein